MNRKLAVQIIIGSIIAVCITSVFFILKLSPVGNDIYGHLYKAQVLTDCIKKGNLYPLYTKEWYNGIQLFRYWPIFTYYVLALLDLLSGSVINAYYLFAGVTFFISYMGWILIGKRENKPVFVFIAIIYWFLPDNLRVFFGEGNLSRVMIASILPLFFYFYTNLIEYKKSFIITSLMVAVITSTHFMLAAMCAIIFVIYGFFSGISKRTQFYGLAAFVAGLMIAGLLLLPGLSGGIVSDSSSAAVDTIEGWSQPLIKSINPFNRMSRAICCSFGLSILLLTIYGIFTAVRTGKSKSGFIIGLVFFILTDSMFTGIFKQLPLSQVFWMSRFVQMTYILILYDYGRMDFKLTENVVIAGLILLDIIPSLMFFDPYMSDDTNLRKDMLLDEAASLTDNRLGLIDESLFGSYPSYYVLENNVPYIQGWAIQGASTAENIINVTEAVKKGYYNYAFDNIIRLGADTVLIRKQFVKDEASLMKSAQAYGYSLADSNENVYLFDITGVSGGFGVVSDYRNIAIGSSSIYISYMYPGFKQGNSDNLSDYSFEELSGYKKIYLSNFTYDDEEETYELIQKLSDAGVEIYIDSTHLPINVLSISEFMGVESRFISIYDLNSIKYRNMNIELNLPYEWYTTYLVPEEGYDVCTYEYGKQTLNYLARKDNITFIGFNLIYLYYEEENEDLLACIDDIMNIGNEDRITQERIVPVDVEYGDNLITVSAPEKVNTTLAYQDNFRADSNIYNDNNLLVVEEGITNIRIGYRYFSIGLICTLFGYAFMLCLFWKLELK